MSIAKHLWVLGLVVGAASGCAPMNVEGFRVHPAPAVPGAPESYPHVTYEDREAYLLGNEWYYRDSSYGWVVFDQEPPALRAYRERTYAKDTSRTR